MITRIQLHPPTNNENRHANVQLMAEGVKNTRCVYVGSVSKVYSPETYLTLGEYFSSVELYENGAYNLFIHNERDELIAFLRVRPE